MLLALAHALSASAAALPSADEVASFPGYGKPSFPHFSGFLNASAAEPGS